MRRSLVANLICILSLFYGYGYAQWTEPVRISEPGGCWYPQILAQGDTLHVVYENTDQFDKISYLRSDDRGESWTERSILSEDSSQTVFPRILHNGIRLMALWRNIAYYQEPGNWNIGYAISDNNGLTWTEPSYILNPGWNHILYFSASGSGPVVNVILSSRIDHDLVFFNVRSSNFGQSWSEPVELFRAAQEIWPDQASMNSLVHYAWSGRFTMDDKIEIFYMRSLDDGINWSSSITLSDSDQFHSQLPAIAADNLGNVAVTWMDFKYAPPGATGDIFLRQSADSGLYWSAENQLTFNHDAFGSDIVLKADTIHIVWEDESQGLLHRIIYYIKSTDEGESWSEPYRIDGTDDDSWNPAMAASNGYVYVVWADGSEESGFGLNFSRYEDETGIIDKGPITPVIIDLQAYPNPFNSSTIITYSGLEGGEIEIYNIGGQKIRTLNIPTKEGKIIWDARDALGNKVSSGIYFARAKTPRNSTTIKLIYLK